MDESEHKLRLLFPWAHLEVDLYEVRAYTPPGVAVPLTREAALGPGLEPVRVALAGHDNFAVYPGVAPDLERDERDDLLQEAMAHPKIQMLMAAFGGELESVKPLKRRK